MKSLHYLANLPSAIPATADDILEFHAARLLLLILFCGTKSPKGAPAKIEGLTKMAKLDFFVRYPEFFDKITAHIQNQKRNFPNVESSMVRHHYGPWDKRYYHVLAYLESKELISVEKNKNTYLFNLTAQGQEVAETLGKKKPFEGLVSQMQAVKKLLGNKKGSHLKKLIYDVFQEEVAHRSLGEVIR
jgi:hypothetical protein